MKGAGILFCSFWKWRIKEAWKDDLLLGIGYGFVMGYLQLSGAGGLRRAGVALGRGEDLLHEISALGLLDTRE